MSGIYDKINQIKKEGNVYDNKNSLVHDSEILDQFARPSKYGRDKSS